MMLQNAGGNFIIRFKGTCNPTVIAVRGADLRRINIKQMPLKKAVKTFRRQTVEMDVCWNKGQRTIPLRGIITRNPEVFYPKMREWLFRVETESSEAETAG
ncbi:MAG: hypothetical protein JXR76_31930 [Deltaproteobacteria bacterium]|nr:hypothetical protein [Deltaproteobacteria bacterium]